MPRRPPAEGQLGLDIALPAAKSARAELSDHAGKAGARKKALGGPYTAWPKLGEALVLLLPVHGPDGPVEAVLAGEFLGLEFDPAEGCNVGRVRLAAQQPGLSASLAASLPAVVSDVRLGMLRKRNGGE
jgi:hypothetical protein